MRVLNGIDRYSLVLMALKYSDYDDKNARKLQEYAREMLDKHVKYIKENGIDMPEITEFTLSEEGV